MAVRRKALSVCFAFLPALVFARWARPGRAASLVTLLTDLPVVSSVSDAGSGAVRVVPSSSSAAVVRACSYDAA